MTVREAIEMLKGFDPDMRVILSSDPEGNKLSPLEVIEIAGYVPETEWYGYADQPEEADEVVAVMVPKG